MPRSAVASVWDLSKPGQKVQWPYDRWFRAHIGQRLQHAFVRQHWDRGLGELLAAGRLAAELHDPCPRLLGGADRGVLDRAVEAGVGSLMDLLDRVPTQEAAATFCRHAGIRPDSLVALLRKVYQYLPFGAQVRQLVGPDDASLLEHVDTLVRHGLGHSLAFLEVGRTPEGRRRLARQMAIAERALLDLARRADLTRLRLMSGGMVRQTWALGYPGLEALRRVTPEGYFAQCQAYYGRTGKGMPFDLTPEAVEAHRSACARLPSWSRSRASGRGRSCGGRPRTDGDGPARPLPGPQPTTASPCTPRRACRPPTENASNTSAATSCARPWPPPACAASTPRPCPSR